MHTTRVVALVAPIPKYVIGGNINKDTIRVCDSGHLHLSKDTEHDCSKAVAIGELFQIYTTGENESYGF